MEKGSTQVRKMVTKSRLLENGRKTFSLREKSPKNRKLTKTQLFLRGAIDFY